MLQTSRRAFSTLRAENQSRRVVVTGIGAITPLGLTFDDSWANLLAGQSGANDLSTALRVQDLPSAQLEQELAAIAAYACQVACPVNYGKYDARTSRFVQFAMEAGKEALQQANLFDWLGIDHENEYVTKKTEQVFENRRFRIGSCVGSGMSGVREIAQATRLTDQSGFRRLSPHFVPKVLSNSAAGRLGIEYSLQGPNHSVSTACAAGSHAIGDAYRCIQYNNADVMLAGGAEACIDPLSIAGFARLRALSISFNETPSMASRPFSDDRDGFVMAEGAAILVLEELEHALERQAPILAELIGYGLTGDAYHITAPDPKGAGAARAISMALQSANVHSSEVDYVNAHATSTPKGDEIEARVLQGTLCGGASLPEDSHCDRRANPLYLSSTKGATGHLLGAAGAIESAFVVKSLVDQRLPPTLNLALNPEPTVSNAQDTEMNNNRTLNHVLFCEHSTCELVNPIEVAMNNSFGFGGTNACLVFRRYHRN